MTLMQQQLFCPTNLTSCVMSHVIPIPNLIRDPEPRARSLSLLVRPALCAALSVAGPSAAETMITGLPRAQKRARVCCASQTCPACVELIPNLRNHAIPNAMPADPPTCPQVRNEDAPCGSIGNAAWLRPQSAPWLIVDVC